MTISVTPLKSNEEKQWDEFIAATPGAQLSHTIQWRNFLVDLLGDEAVYLVAKDDLGAIKGVLPGFLCQGPYGKVLNSLPFFGSNGGIVSSNIDSEVYQALFDAWGGIAEENSCVTSTIICSPFFDDSELYDRFCSYDHMDERIGQITDIKFKGDVETRLFESFSSVRRRNIRKARKNNVRVVRREGPADIDFLERTHLQNMAHIGGKTKPHRFFQLLNTHFTLGRDCLVYMALLDDAPISALLLFKYNGIVEYFTPVVLAEYRDLASQSLVIFEAMAEAAQDGMTYWNWGGTWKSQKGVHSFKSKWGSKEKIYKYFTKVYDKALLSRKMSELSEGYPYAYVVPFDVLSASHRRKN